MLSWPARLTVARKSIARVPNQKVAKQPKNFLYFFLLLLQMGYFKLCDYFMMVLYKVAAFHTEQCMYPSLLRGLRYYYRYWYIGTKLSKYKGRDRYYSPTPRELPTSVTRTHTHTDTPTTIHTFKIVMYWYCSCSLQALGATLHLRHRVYSSV